MNDKVNNDIQVLMNWKDYIFNELSNIKKPMVGSRLGIQYTQSIKEFITIKLNDNKSYNFYQVSIGMMAISGVIWDASLYLIDFLIQLEQNFLNQYKILDIIETMKNNVDNINDNEYKNKNNECNNNIINHNNILNSFKLGRTLDLGCGTGIAGISSLLLNSSSYVLFSDMYKMDCLDDNLNSLLDNQSNKYDFVNYTWNEDYLPNEFLSKCVSNVNSIDNKDNNNIADNNIDNSKQHDNSINFIWDTIICSDLLYDEKYHHVLLSVLKRLTFTRAIFSYKKRHHEPELLFFEQINNNFSIEVIASNSIILNNLPIHALSNLYLLIIKPK